jgi:hypothetical protein
MGLEGIMFNKTEAVKILTVYNASFPEGLGTPGDRRGAESITSGVNLVAVSVIVV